jgi:3-oxoacid CoA-transferase A subunit
MAINKVVRTFDEAVADIQDGATVLIGYFAGPGDCPSYLIAALARRRARELTIVSNLGGFGLQGTEKFLRQFRSILPVKEDWYDPGLLAELGLVRKGICTAPTTSGVPESPFAQGVVSGEIELDLIPQGTLAEAVRCGRAGIPAFYTPVGVGTFREEGQEVREFDGRKYLLQHAIRGDFSLIRAEKADPYGNLVYRGTARTFNAAMAGASRVTIAEVEELVELGEIEPEHVVTPGVYVDRVVLRPKTRRPWNAPM